MLSFLRPDRHRSVERRLTAAARGAEPFPGTEARLRNTLLRRIDAPASLLQARTHMDPSEDARWRVWNHIASRIDLPLQESGVWDRVRASLSPAADIRFALASSVQSRLSPQRFFFARAVRWTAVAAVLLLAVRMTPLVFFAPHSSADSPVLLIPAQGEVSVLVGGLWQPVRGEVTLQKTATVRTGENGRATLIVHDDGVLRFGPDTTATLQDIADRPERVAQTSTLTLETGTLWVQSLVPEALAPGWVVMLPEGQVLVNEGSVSLSADNGKTEVDVWDRLAHVRRGDRELTLVAGEGAHVSPSMLAVIHTDASREEDPWVEENLRKDAVHRREIALLQQERRAKSAGILPTSTLYPVKRVAEAVDVLFTFGQEAKAQKLLEQANTRLNEAAALLQTGSGAQEAAEAPLKEYRSTLLAVATGSGQGPALRALVRQQIALEAADVAAALPGDSSYLLKKTVLETSAALPESGVTPEDVQGALFIDAIAALTRRAQEGDVAGAASTFRILASGSTLMDGTSSISAAMRKEARAALSLFADTVRDQSEKTASGAALLSDIAPYLPGFAPAQAAVRAMTDEEIDTLVLQMENRIFLYKQPRSRYDQLLVEFRSVEGNPDQGRILRRLYRTLPENGLARYVRTEFQKVREEVGSR